MQNRALKRYFPILWLHKKCKTLGAFHHILIE